MSLFYLAVSCTGPDDIKGSQFFGFPHWWKYIKNTEVDALGNCVPKFSFPNDIWAVAFAVTDMLLYLAGIVAVISIIIAGVSHITSDGNPEKAAAARKRIYNALIGLAIVLIASGVVSFIGNKVG
jgi:hypothetical protein